MKIQSSPQLIIYNSKIYNLSSKETALAVSDDKIIAIGSDDEVLSIATPETIKINGQNRWLLPAFMDSHTHLAEYAARKLKVDLSNCKSLDEAIAKIKLKVEEYSEGSWVTGGGWDKNSWGLKDFPNKELLDEISTQHFIALDSKDWHSLWVNSAALGKCGIDQDFTAMDDGNVIRNANGELSGIFQENARQFIFNKIPSLTFEETKPALLKTFSEFHRFGITAVHSMEAPLDFSFYLQLFFENNLGLRIFWYLPVKFLSNIEKLKIHSGFGNSSLKICGVKLFADGALGSQTAEMLNKYDGLDHNGVSVLSEDELHELVGRCVSQKLSCAVHAIGDKANRKVLNTFSDFTAESKKVDLRHRIEHAQLLHPDDISKFQEYNVIASVQPIHLAADIPMIKTYWRERGRFAYAFNSIANSGGKLIFGSDTPIESIDPWKGIYTAIQRKYLVNPKEDSFYPEEKINIADSIQAYTSDSVWAVKEEMNLGSIEIGKKADLIMIDKDIFSESPETLLDTEVILTVMDGKIVYQNVNYD